MALRGTPLRKADPHPASSRKLKAKDRTRQHELTGGIDRGSHKDRDRNYRVIGPTERVQLGHEAEKLVERYLLGQRRRKT